MNEKLITTWTPILKSLPEGQRERAQQLLDKHGETHPNNFLVELLEILGVHAAYMQTLPERISQVGEQTKGQMDTAASAATSMQERTRLELEKIVSGIARAGESFNLALKEATAAEEKVTKEVGAGIEAKIQDAFEKHGIASLTATLKEIQSSAAQGKESAAYVQQEAGKRKDEAQERWNFIESETEKSLSRLEGFNWKAAWGICGGIWLALLILCGGGVFYWLQTSERTRLAEEIADASATIKQNREVFAELAAANIPLAVKQARDSNGQPIPGGFAVIVENAQAAEMRENASGKAGVVLVQTQRLPEQVQLLRLRIHELLKTLGAADK
ncbi:MAG TPA: hypothetical protein VGN61_01035 [Verrucomicrobiae bacterium]|jgi:hypothetical protein